jgi:hypothetical protein
MWHSSIACRATRASADGSSTSRRSTPAPPSADSKKSRRRRSALLGNGSDASSLSSSWNTTWIAFFNAASSEAITSTGCGSGSSTTRQLRLSSTNGITRRARGPVGDSSGESSSSLPQYPLSMSSTKPSCSGFARRRRPRLIRQIVAVSP